MVKFKLLDLFCGGGGSGSGYDDAGFDVTGVDLYMQPRYQFNFIQSDAFTYLAAHGNKYDAIHASPPCQHYSVSTHMFKSKGKVYPDLILETRERLSNIGLFYIIENVAGAPLLNPLMLCGTMFGKLYYRHRLFETNWPISLAPGMGCKHDLEYIGQHITSKHKLTNKQHFSFVGHSSHTAVVKSRMELPWLGQKELSQAIPPCYTKYIGDKLMRMLK